MKQVNSPWRGFLPYGAAAFLIGIVGGFSSVLGPAFVRDLGLGENNTTWAALAQAISTAACAPVLGKAGDLFGRKITLLLGLGVYTLGNVLTALSDSLRMMLAARFVVGLGTAAMAPLILAYIVTAFPEQAVAKGFSVYMLLSSGAVVFGPTLGSMMLATLGWRGMIWICVGICAVVFCVCAFTGERARFRRGEVEQFDTAGAVLVPVFFGLVLCLPAFGQNFGWRSGAFLGTLAAGAISLASLIAVEGRAERPILPGRFIRRRVFLLSVLALFLTQGLMQANMTNTIVFVHHTQPEKGLLAGYAVSALYLGMSVGSVLLGPLGDRFAPRGVLCAALGLTGLGCAGMLLYTDNTPGWLLMGALGLQGLGLGGNATILMKVALSGLPPEEAGAGTGTYGLFRDLAAPFGVVVFVPLFTNRITGEIAGGAARASAVVTAMYTLAVMELVCVGLGIVTVLCLPKTGRKKESSQ